MDVFQFSTVLGVLVIAAQALIVILFFDRFIGDMLGKKIRGMFTHHSVALAWVVAIASTVFPLVFSNLYTLNPCNLCWYQRIFMFPLFFMLGIATFKHDDDIKPYAKVLAGVGALVSLYHYAQQKFGLASVCDVVGQSAACSGIYIDVFGYITIPMMALTAFLLIIMILSVKEK